MVEVILFHFYCIQNVTARMFSFCNSISFH
jgi:hypothetical protein